MAASFLYLTDGLSMLKIMIPYILSANRMGDWHALKQHTKEQKEETDDGVLIYTQKDWYEFHDGKRLICEREVDDVSSDAMCPECWITYILYDQEQAVLARKSFISFCQESFWLKRHYEEMQA